MLVTSTPPKPAAARLSSSAVRFWLSTALPIHHQRVHGLASGVVWGHARSGACPSATRARRSNGRTATFTWTTLLIASPTGPHPLIPSPCGRGETRHALLFPLSRRERGPGVRTLMAREEWWDVSGGRASKTAHSRTTAPYPPASARRGSPRRSFRRTPERRGSP